MKRSALISGAALVLTALAPHMAPVSAQTLPLTQTVSPATTIIVPVDKDGVPVLEETPIDTQSRAIPVRNVRADVMAHWLDPTHNSVAAPFDAPSPLLREPINEVIKAQETGKPVSWKGNALPEGIRGVTAIAPQNVLLAYGTPKALDSLQTTVALLDKPLRQIEIELQAVQVDNDEVQKALTGVQTQPGEVQPGTITVGFPRSNWKTNLEALQKEGKARVLTAPRILAINNMEASLTLARTVGDVSLKPQQTNEGLTRELATLAPFTISSDTTFTVTPTINNDDSLTLLMQPKRELNLTVEQKNKVALATVGNLLTVVNTRDGDAIVLLGLTSSWIDPASNTPDTPVVVFVKPSLVRKIGEDK